MTTVLQIIAAWLVISLLASIAIARVLAFGSDKDELLLTPDMIAPPQIEDIFPVAEKRLHPGAVL